MEYQITVQTVAPQLIAAARQRTTSRMISKEIGPLLSAPWTYLRAQPAFKPDVRNVAIYWDMRNGGSIEVGVEVTAPFDATNDVVCSGTPGGTVAMTTHVGSYTQLGAAHDAVMAWSRQNAREIVMPFWEIYGHWDNDPAKVRTDVLYLLK